MKVALFAFNGEPMCFAHVLLNAFAMREQGWEATIVIEGAATALVKAFADDPAKPFAKLYARARDEGLIDGVCRACAKKMGSADSAREQGLTLLDEMGGHPSIARYMEAGWTVLTF